MILRIGQAHRSSAGFTLIEFILVMTLLMIVMGVAAPSLSNFFRGRTLDSEARRLLTLTRYGQSRAVSESVPMILWIDNANGRYGLEREYGYETIDPKSVIYELDPELEIEAVLGPAQERNVSALGQSEAARRNLPLLRFQPDGFPGEGTVQAVEIRELDTQDRARWIARDRSGLRYEIQTNLTLLMNLKQ